MADPWETSATSRASSSQHEGGGKKKHKRFKTKFSHSKAKKRVGKHKPPPLPSPSHDAMQGEEEGPRAGSCSADAHGGRGSLVDRKCWCTCSKDGKVYTARILQQEGDRLKVHYIGWNDKYDEWVKIKRVVRFLDKNEHAEGDRGAKNKVGGPMRFSDPLLFFCYECYEGGKLLSCDCCPRRYHRECVGQALEAEEVKVSRDQGWVCQLCSASKGRLCFPDRVNRLQQACDKFHMKHAVATFGRQTVRVSELYSQCVKSGLTGSQLVQFSSAQEAIDYLTKMVDQESARGDSPTKQADMLVYGASALSQPGGSDLLHCDVCGYSRVEVGCSTCPAAFHLRCLNLEQHMNGDVPADWRCRICLHEASLTSEAMQSFEAVLTADDPLLVPSIASCDRPAVEADASPTRAAKKARRGVAEVVQVGEELKDQDQEPAQVLERDQEAEEELPKHQQLPVQQQQQEEEGVEDEIQQLAKHQRQEEAQLEHVQEQQDDEQNMRVKQQDEHDKIQEQQGQQKRLEDSVGPEQRMEEGTAEQGIEMEENEICGLGVSRANMPEEPVLCCSCGFFEQESVRCDVCFRWFCFGCTCLSLQTLPAGSFTCPECLGIDQYDAQLAVSMEVVRNRIQGGKVCLQEVDMFAQTVYDLLATCAWKEFTINLMVLMQLVEMQIKHNHLPTVLPFHSVHYPLPKEIVRDIARSHSNQKLQDVMRAEKVKEVELKLFKVKEAPSSPQSPPPKLRIGYVSADFVNHPTADLMQSALLLHDTSKFEIFLYSITRNDSSMYRQVLQREIPNFRLLPNAKNDKACAQMIADDEIDILVNLNSHTAGERNGIFAFRPAPLQVVYLAYPGTHGASYLDYNVVDMVVSPKEHREMYTESLIYMPHCYQTNSFQDLYPEILSSSCLPSRKDHGLPEHALVFCTFNRLGRITEHIFHAWIRILKRVPNSVLWLYKHPTMAVLRLLRAAREQGIDATRFVFAGPMMPKIEHLKRLTLADVYLDTHIYNGHTTGSDFLWAGVPMVTLQGDTFPSRVGASLARAVGMQEMIATDLAGYEEKAVELGNNKEALEEMKAKLKAARLTAPLFDTARWVGSFEDALTRMWERHARGLEPEDIFPIDPGAKHRVLSDSDSSKKWKEEKGDAFRPDASASR